MSNQSDPMKLLMQMYNVSPTNTQQPYRNVLDILQSTEEKRRAERLNEEHAMRQSSDNTAAEISKRLALDDQLAQNKAQDEARMKFSYQQLAQQEALEKARLAQQERHFRDSMELKIQQAAEERQQKMQEQIDKQREEGDKELIAQLVPSRKLETKEKASLASDRDALHHGSKLLGDLIKLVPDLTSDSTMGNLYKRYSKQTIGGFNLIGADQDVIDKHAKATRDVKLLKEILLRHAKLSGTVPALADMEKVLDFENQTPAVFIKDMKAIQEMFKEEVKKYNAKIKTGEEIEVRPEVLKAYEEKSETWNALPPNIKKEFEKKIRYYKDNNIMHLLTPVYKEEAEGVEGVEGVEDEARGGAVDTSLKETTPKEGGFWSGVGKGAGNLLTGAAQSAANLVTGAGNLIAPGGDPMLNAALASQGKKMDVEKMKAPELVELINEVLGSQVLDKESGWHKAGEIAGSIGLGMGAGMGGASAAARLGAGGIGKAIGSALGTGAEAYVSDQGDDMDKAKSAGIAAGLDLALPPVFGWLGKKTLPYIKKMFGKDIKMQDKISALADDPDVARIAKEFGDSAPSVDELLNMKLADPNLDPALKETLQNLAPHPDASAFTKFGIEPNSKVSGHMRQVLKQIDDKVGDVKNAFIDDLDEAAKQEILQGNPKELAYKILADSEKRNAEKASGLYGEFQDTFRNNLINIDASDDLEKALKAIQPYALIKKAKLPEFIKEQDALVKQLGEDLRSRPTLYDEEKLAGVVDDDVRLALGDVDGRHNLKRADVTKKALEDLQKREEAALKLAGEPINNNDSYVMTAEMGHKINSSAKTHLRALEKRGNKATPAEEDKFERLKQYIEDATEKTLGKEVFSKYKEASRYYKDNVAPFNLLKTKDPTKLEVFNSLSKLGQSEEHRVMLDAIPDADQKKIAVLMLSELEGFKATDVKHMKKTFENLTGPQKQFIEERIPRVKKEIEYLTKLIEHIGAPYKKSLSFGVTGKTNAPQLDKILGHSATALLGGIGYMTLDAFGAGLGLVSRMVTGRAMKSILSNNTVSQQKKAIKSLLQNIENQAIVDAPRIFAGDKAKQSEFIKGSKVLGKILITDPSADTQSRLVKVLSRKVVEQLIDDSEKVVDKKQSK